MIYDQKTEKTLEDLGPGLSLKLEELESEDADKLLDAWLGMEPMDIESPAEGGPKDSFSIRTAF